MNFLSRRIDLHFVDSPEVAARREGFVESDRIIDALKIPKSRIFKHECVTQSELESTLLKIADWKRDYAYPRKALPLVHIAAHGVADGLILGSEEPVGWWQLLEYLRPIAVRTDYNALLAMSSCHGFYAYRLACLDEDKPYHLAIGPTTAIKQKYLISGFADFYNRVLVEGISLSAAIRFVNDSIRESPAKLDYTFGWEVQGHFREKGIDDVEVIARRKKQSARKK